MKIGKPTHIPPPRKNRTGGRYRAAYLAAIQAAGKWVPVYFDDIRAARNFRSSVYQQHEFRLEARRRWLTVFLRQPSKGEA